MFFALLPSTWFFSCWWRVCATRRANRARELAGECADKRGDFNTHLLPPTHTPQIHASFLRNLISIFNTFYSFFPTLDSQSLSIWDHCFSHFFRGTFYSTLPPSSFFIKFYSFFILMDSPRGTHYHLNSYDIFFVLHAFDQLYGQEHHHDVHGC